MANNRDTVFIKQNIFGKCVDLFAGSLCSITCLFMIASIIDHLSQKQFFIAGIYSIFFVILIVAAYISVVHLNQKVGFSPDGIILLRGNSVRTWEYENIDWLACRYGEAQLPHAGTGRFLGRLFFKPIMEGVIFCYRGKIINLSTFSGKEFRRLARFHIEPRKMITFIQARKLLSETSRLAKINYKMSYNPYGVLLAVVLVLGVFFFVLMRA